MFTTQEVIDGFREIIRQTSDDSVYSDQFLYYQLNLVRIQLMRQYLNDKKPLSPWLYQRFCIKLCPSTFMECNCAPFDFACTIWRSEKPIPKPLTTDSGYIAEFSELYGEELMPVTENASRYLKYRKYKKSMYYLIADVRGEKYLFIIDGRNNGVKPPKYIKINAVLEDPSAADVVACNEEECPCLEGSGFPIESHLLLSAYKLAMEMLSISMSMREDRSNNAEGELKGFRPPRREEE